MYICTHLFKVAPCSVSSPQEKLPPVTETGTSPSVGESKINDSILIYSVSYRILCISSTMTPPLYETLFCLV